MDAIQPIHIVGSAIGIVITLCFSGALICQRLDRIIKLLEQKRPSREGE